LWPIKKIEVFSVEQVGFEMSKLFELIPPKSASQCDYYGFIQMHILDDNVRTKPR